MAPITSLSQMTGKWQGSNHLWLMPGEPVRISETIAEIQPIAHDQFHEMRYTWADEGNPQEGRLIVGQADSEGTAKIIWFDTWHMADSFMLLEGVVAASGAVNVLGRYPAPPGPDWGWRITIESPAQDSFRLCMFNITPEGEEFLAVEVDYQRMV